MLLVGGGERGNRRDDFVYLRFVKFGVDRDAQNFFGEAVGRRAALAGGFWQVLEAGLLVEGLGIIDFTANFLIHEVLF